ncbi:WD40 repeat-like protein [Trichoderma austrokoningii]
MAQSNLSRFMPLTCHGHSRPVPHISFSMWQKEETFFLISACKDGNPMIRDGVTGDWIGTFLGHKGAVWQVRLSPDTMTAATASADFTVKIWDTHTGELMITIPHPHVVRAVAYSPYNSQLVATGDMEKKVRVFDLSRVEAVPVPGAPVTIPSTDGTEVGEGLHQGAIKFICWTGDPDTIVTASDKTLRWFDIRMRIVLHTHVLPNEIRSCEMTNRAPEFTSEHDIGRGIPVLCVAAGDSAYFWGGERALEFLKRISLPYAIASVALDVHHRKVVVGEEWPGTWARVISYDDESVIDIHKGHHGPILSIAFSPDGELYATASEDGTIKLWKNREGYYGLWRGANERPAQ